MSALLDVRDLEVSYGQARALNGVSFSVPSNGLMAIVGSNGAGKTSLVRAIAGMLRPSSGRIVFDGTDITGRDSSETCELGIGQVAEGRQIFPTLTVEENLQLGGALKRAAANRSRNMARVLEMFPRLAERRGQKAGALSGGEQQMLAIGRGLASAPDLLMLDEPSMGLAPAVVDAIFERIRQIHRDRGLTILLVEQRVVEALGSCDHGYVLETGRVVLSGPRDVIMSNAEVRRAYLGM